MEKNSKIYVAGHRGLVGSAIMRGLREKGYENFTTRTSTELDLRRQSEVETFFQSERPEYVIMSAAKVGGILANNTYKAEFIYDNVIIAANVIHAAYKYGVQKLLNLGSSCIYPKFAPQPMKEEHLLTGPLEPTNEPYAIAKITAIKLCKYYNEQYGTNFLSVMPTNLYGPCDNFNLETAHVLPALIRKLHLARLLRIGNYAEIEKDIKRFSMGFNLSNNFDKNFNLVQLGITPEYVEIWGSGVPFREFLYVDDLADACIFLLETYAAKDIGEFVNIGAGDDIRIIDLAKLIKEITGFEGTIKNDPSKPDGTPKKLLDISRIKSLGWTPRTSLSEGIRKTYSWYTETASE
ncbi:MAG: GDP-L-fucose synthase [Candidatus Omnitrophica bacterium]|nr:GDP-L-fucose synthase [Candidatus Omnitrophota bacterium]